MIPEIFSGLPNMSVIEYVWIWWVLTVVYQVIMCTLMSIWLDLSHYGVICDVTRPKWPKPTQIWFHYNSHNESMLFEPKNGFLSVLLRKLKKHLRAFTMCFFRVFVPKIGGTSIFYSFLITNLIGNRPRVCRNNGSVSIRTKVMQKTIKYGENW